MASGDVYKITLNCTLDAVQCLPGFYLVEGAGGAGINAEENAAQAVVDALGGASAAGFVQNLKINGVKADNIQPGTRGPRTIQVAGGTGTIADDNPPPPQDSMLITLYSDVRRIEGAFAAIGRMYMPGIYSTGQISGFLTATLKTALDVFTEKLNAPFVTDGTAYQMHVVSFNPGSNPRTIRALNPVTFMLPSNQVAIQRSRRPGTGI